MMEEIASRLDLDELFDHLFLWNVTHDDILRVLFDDCESVWYSGVIFCLLSFDCLLELINVLTSHELWMLHYLSK